MVRPRFGPSLLHLLHLSFDLVPVRIWFGGEGEARSPSRVGPTSAAPHCMPDLIPPSSQSEMGPHREHTFSSNSHLGSWIDPSEFDQNTQLEVGDSINNSENGNSAPQVIYAASGCRVKFQPFIFHFGIKPL